MNQKSLDKGKGIKEIRIKCANCGEKTGFYPSDFPTNYDLNDIFCSESCRYNFETGKPGEEY